MTFEERKHECINRGIVEGVTVACASDDPSRKDGFEGTHGIVWPLVRWATNSVDDVICGKDNDGFPLFAWYWDSDSDLDRYAEVIHAAPDDEVTRLRERVQELECALEDVCSYWKRVEERGDQFEGMCQPIEDARAILNKTNTPDQP